MSLYGDSFFDRNWKTPLIIAIIVLVVIVGGYLTTYINFPYFGGSNLSAKFSDNPLVLSKNTNTMLEITVKNDSEMDSTNSIVTVTPVEDSLVVFCPDSNSADNRTITISKIASGNTRTIYCDIRYTEITTILEGTYSFDIKYLLNEEQSFKRVKLAVRK
ncbi:MAG: hypothetical protein WCF78_04250 [archaeon]